MPIDNEKDTHQNLLALVQEVIQLDDELRTKYQVGNKFRFVKDRLHALQSALEKNLNEAAIAAAEKKAGGAQAAEEVLVYVYIFNVNGLSIRNWKNMVLPKVFYEYSINRPVYADKNHIESFLRSKGNKTQHAYLTVAIKPGEVLSQPADSAPLKDALGNPLVRVKEGSLKFNKLIVFTHNEHEYVVTDQGEFVKKEDA